MSDRLDISKVRKAQKKSIIIPNWLIEGELVYSEHYQRNLKVNGYLGDIVHGGTNQKKSLISF